MVRIKERYLLVNIFYPPETSKLGKPGLPSHVVQHQPTTEDLTFKTLQKALKKEIALLFGDYGAGVLGNIRGQFVDSRVAGTNLSLTVRSQVSVSCDIDLHPTVSQSSLPDALVGVDFHGPYSNCAG